MEASGLGEVCPACGVPAKQFEPFDDRVNEGRRKLIDLHIHPVIVHAPQAFALALLVLAPLMAVIGGATGIQITDTARVIGVALPFTVLAALSSGLFAAKLRFRKTSAPILQKKKLFGVIFFLASVGLSLFALYSPLDSALALILFGLLAAVALGCGSVLGLLGTPLLVAKFPG
jgi:uncharacterized membrane protein